MINWQGTVISEYNQSPTIQTLLYAMNQWLDPAADLDDFYNLVWNVETAQGYGLDVWGRIVAVDRVLRIQVNDPFFGFDEASTLSAWPFNQGVFYNGEPLTGNYALSDDGFRMLILAKAAFNIIDGSIQAINQLLINLFGHLGKAYLVDHRNMSMSYVFEFTPTPVISAVIGQSGVLPRPSGVAVSYVFTARGTTLWFDDSEGIGGVGRLRANATVTFHVPVGGVGGVRATARVIARPAVRLGGLGTFGASATTILAVARASGAALGGAGGMRATATVQVQASGAAALGGAGAVHAVGMRLVQAGVMIAGTGGTWGFSGEVHPGGAMIAGTGAVRGSVALLAGGTATLAGVGTLGANSLGPRVQGAARIGGAGGARANATVI